MTTIVGLPLGLALLLLAPLATGQSTLGELLDTGAQKLSAEEFRRDIVQRSIVGPTPAGATIELMYVTNGSIVGMGNVIAAAQSQITNTSFSGEWTIDDAGRICASMRTPGPGSTFGAASAILPPRCQTWFKLGDAYFVSDSDSDRRAKVLRRTIQSSSVPVATPDLGRLLAAGASKLSAAEFKQYVYGRTIVGPLPERGTLSVMYAADGSIHGVASSLGYYQQYRADSFEVSGSWTIADDDRVCATMKIRHRESNRTVEDFPQRCQFWFRLGDELFIADSASEPDAKVLRRTIRP